jgi:hypothetical protein
MSKRYNLTIVNEFESKGEKAKKYTTVGVAFYNKESDTLSVRINPNISVHGELVLFPQESMKKKSSKK